jgi:hypothetical protein
MARKRKAKLSHYLISDDFRREVNDKVTLVGITIKKKIPLQIPSIIPTICFNLFLKDVFHEDKFRATLTDPQQKEILKVDGLSVKFPEDKLSGDCILTIIANGMKIEKEGPYLFKLFLNNESKEFGSFTIQFIKFKSKE